MLVENGNRQGLMRAPASFFALDEPGFNARQADQDERKEERGRGPLAWTGLGWTNLALISQFGPGLPRLCRQSVAMWCGGHLQQELQ